MALKGFTKIRARETKNIKKIEIMCVCMWFWFTPIELNKE